jgi:hypothetical protein
VIQVADHGDDPDATRGFAPVTGPGPSARRWHWVLLAAASMIVAELVVAALLLVLR